MNAMGKLLDRMLPLISMGAAPGAANVYGFCHWMNSPELSVYVVTAFAGAAGTEVPLPGKATVGTTFTCVPSVIARICPHCGPGSLSLLPLASLGTTVM